MSLGNVHGFQFSHGLEYVQQLLYPIAPVWDILAYDIKDGASCTFYELVDVPDLTLKQPWDRTPLPVGGSFSVTANAAVAETTGLTYTVPTGRRLWLGQGELWVSPAVAQPAGARIYLYLRVASVRFSQLFVYTALPSQRYSANLPPGGLVVNPSQVIDILYAVSAANNSVDIGASFGGYLFDA